MRELFDNSPTLDQKDKEAIESLLDGHLGFTDVIIGIRDHYREKARNGDSIMRRVFEIRYEHLQRFLQMLHY